MADNTTVNPGFGGDVVATDDIGGVKYQRLKLIHGADGQNDGDVAVGNPLPVAVPPISSVFVGTGINQADGVQAVTGAGEFWGIIALHKNLLGTALWLYDTASDTVDAGDASAMLVFGVPGEPNGDRDYRSLILPWPVLFTSGIRIYADDKDGIDPVLSAAAIVFYRQ